MAVSKTNKERMPELLAQYKAGGDVNIRNEIVLMNIDMVKIVVHTMRNIYQGFAETDDIINEGVIALITAIDAFDPAKNVKFETYASIRIKGAVIDYLRKLDRVPRQLRKLSRQLEDKYAEFSAAHGRAPTDAELAGLMGITEQQLSRLLSNTAGMITLSFEELLYEDNIEQGMLGEYNETAETRLYEKEKKTVIADAISSLPERERQVVTLYYYEKMKFKDIARVLDISPARVSQMHSKAMLSLRTKLDKYINS